MANKVSKYLKNLDKETNQAMSAGESLKLKKGYHKMPDGSMMKNSDMKQKSAKKKVAKKSAKKAKKRGLFGGM